MRESKKICYTECMRLPVCHIPSISVEEILVRGNVPTTKQRTSFHRCFGILSASVIGSINVSFITRVSGIQIAHKRCTQSPSTVCLNAPPSFGHKMHDYGEKAVR